HSLNTPTPFARGGFPRGRQQMWRHLGTRWANMGLHGLIWESMGNEHDAVGNPEADSSGRRLATKPKPTASWLDAAGVLTQPRRSGPWEGGRPVALLARSQL